ncbi:MAG: hypothetical protein M3129_04330 [Thermoproteota archaeon]|nr:hypothetical protein [Thermoproteota archaeon]
MAHYQTAQAFVARVQELWIELKTEAPLTAAQAVIEIEAALPDLPACFLVAFMIAPIVTLILSCQKPLKFITLGFPIV